MNVFNSRFSYKSGFTLIELIVVLAIIGLLATGVIAVLNPYVQVQKSRDAQRKSDLRQIQTALELYNQDNNGQYPATGTVPFGSPWPASGAYMSSVPNDPTGKSYYYAQDDTNGVKSGYRLWAALDRTTDPQACASIGCAAPIPATNCGGACNYEVTSSNLSR